MITFLFTIGFQSSSHPGLLPPREWYKPDEIRSFIQDSEARAESLFRMSYAQASRLPKMSKSQGLQSTVIRFSNRSALGVRIFRDKSAANVYQGLLFRSSGQNGRLAKRVSFYSGVLGDATFSTGNVGKVSASLKIQNKELGIEIDHFSYIGQTKEGFPEFSTRVTKEDLVRMERVAKYVLRRIDELKER